MINVPKFFSEFLQIRANSSTEQIQKRQNTKVIGPMISLMGVPFLAMHFERSTRWYLALALGFAAMLINQIVVFLLNHRVVQASNKRWSIRDDNVDVIRESLTLILVDLPLCLILRPTAATLACFWMVLTVGFAMEMYKLRHRLFIVSITTVAALYTLSAIHSLPLVQLSFYAICATCILIIITAIEFSWLSEAGNRLRLQQEEVRLNIEAESLRSNALIGEHSRTIAHELNNLMMVIDLSVANPNRVNVPAIKASLAQIHNLNDLVLNDLKNRNVVRLLRITDLIHNIEITLGKQVQSKAIQWECARPETPTNDAPVTIRERQGSLFLILQNLICNSMHAHLQAGRHGWIRNEFYYDDSSVKILIADNAGGLPEPVQDFLNRAAPYPDSISGHGLGLRFVMAECKKNGFEIHFETTLGEGTTFTLTVPRTASPHTPPFDITRAP